MININAAYLQRRLTTKTYGRSVRLLQQTKSTMDDARDDALKGAVSGHVVIADQQTQGRGSRGRHWLSPHGTDLYLSIVVRTSASLVIEVADLSPMTLAVGLAVAETAEAVTNTPALVKWPNDVWLYEKKCAGVLVETRTSEDFVIVGLGLNINRTVWPEELASTATSLREASDSGEELDRTEVLAALLKNVEQRIDAFLQGNTKDMIADLNQRLVWKGKQVCCGNVQGMLIKLASHGALRVRTNTGVVNVVAGTLELSK